MTENVALDQNIGFRKVTVHSKAWLTTPWRSDRSGWPEKVSLHTRGRQFFHPAGRVLTDSQQHIGQVGVGIDIVELTGADQTLDNADVRRADFGTAEHPVLPIMPTFP